jgi:hypothetical protein
MKHIFKSSSLTTAPEKRIPAADEGKSSHGDRMKMQDFVEEAAHINVKRETGDCKRKTKSHADQAWRRRK